MRRAVMLDRWRRVITAYSRFQSVGVGATLGGPAHGLDDWQRLTVGDECMRATDVYMR